jgi:LysR family glycine cleavage system transcriptional activator
MDWSGQTLLHTIGFAQGWQHWMAESQIKRKTQATDIEFDSAQLCLEAASLGHGIALARSSFVSDYLDSKRLVALRGASLEAKDNVFLTVALGLSAQAPAAVFRDYLLSKAEPPPTQSHQP